MRSIHPWNFITLARVVLEICSRQRTGRRPPAMGDPIIRPVFDGRIKRWKCWLPAFSPFYTCFQKLSFPAFLTHLSTKCSEWAIVIVLCPPCVVNFSPCVRSRGHIFRLIIMKLDQNVNFVLINSRTSSKRCQFKNWVTRSNLRKTLCRL